jgi:hypothetical protein
MSRLASAQDVDAALMLLAFSADWLAGIVEPRTEDAGSYYAAVAPPVTESNCMDASFMSLELHGRGVHVV